jgi:MFS family permease
MAFLDFMTGGDLSELGSYTGAIVSGFFITQFLTSLLWATVANKHGNRAVLFIALLGNAFTCALFGTSKTFAEAIVIRLIMGVFNGAVGYVFIF